MRCIALQEEVADPALGRGEEVGVELNPLRLPLLFPSLRLEQQLLLQPLLARLRQVANFDCFCVGNLVKWNPLIW